MVTVDVGRPRVESQCCGETGRRGDRRYFPVPSICSGELREVVEMGRGAVGPTGNWRTVNTVVMDGIYTFWHWQARVLLRKNIPNFFL